jgi:hypothetical protein
VIPKPLGETATAKLIGDGSQGRSIVNAAPRATTSPAWCERDKPTPIWIRSYDLQRCNGKRKPMFVTTLSEHSPQLTGNVLQPSELHHGLPLRHIDRVIAGKGLFLRGRGSILLMCSQYLKHGGRRLCARVGITSASATSRTEPRTARPVIAPAASIRRACRVCRASSAGRDRGRTPGPGPSRRGSACAAPRGAACRRRGAA